METSATDNETPQHAAEAGPRTSGPKAKPKPEKIRVELNIERWPAMWQPSKSKTKPAVRTFSREMTFADGSRGTAELEVGYTQFGTITTEDQRMLHVLVKQWEDSGKPGAQVFFSDRLLARLLKKSWGTNVVDALPCPCMCVEYLSIWYPAPPDRLFQQGQAACRKRGDFTSTKI